MTSPEICLGVTGSIAAYKSCELARLLVKSGYTVSVVMTSNATEFVRPLTFRTLTSRPVITGMFDEPEQCETEHISLAHRVAAIVIAPATANVVGKLAHGIADDFLTTSVLAAECPVIIAPAMNHSMLANPIYRENELRLRQLGFVFVGPESGDLACGERGAGRMAEPKHIFDSVESVVRVSQSLAGERVLVTAGPTREHIDSVRYLSNPSTGKMGYEIARAAALRGANVTLVSGPSTEIPPYGVEIVRVTTAADMNDAVQRLADRCTIFVGAAAVADYRPVSVSNTKIKKTNGPLKIEWERTEDVLANLSAAAPPDSIIIGFAAETDNVVDNARAKMKAKGLDMVVANRVGVHDQRR